MNREALELLFERKSVRAYLDREVPPDVQESIIKAALRAPTGGNMMLYSILRITDQKEKERLSETCDHQPFIAKAPLVLVFVADYHRWIQRFESAEGRRLRSPGKGDLLLACADAIIAAQNAVIAAETFGLGSCYIGDIIENFEIHRALFHLPPHTAPVAMLCIGYPTEQQKNRKKTERLDPSVLVYDNHYPEDTAALSNSMCHPEEASALCKRKFEADFSLEMNRSAEKILENWVGEGDSGRE